jgi:hypothetical protein
MSVRTRVELGDKETAVLVRVPVRIETLRPVHLVVERYDKHGLVMTANGKGPIQVAMPDGKSHTVELDGQQSIHVPAETQQ